MKVKEIMTENATACTLTSNLAEAAWLMWDNDCGILPVVAQDRKVVGLITDRDICMVAAIKDRSLANIALKGAFSGKVYSCARDDDVRTALNTMQENKVRRLAVVGQDGTLEGILSINDIVRNAQEAANKNAPELSYSEVVTIYKAICAHRLPPQQQTLRMAAEA